MEVSSDGVEEVQERVYTGRVTPEGTEGIKFIRIRWESMKVEGRDEVERGRQNTDRPSHIYIKE